MNVLVVGSGAREHALVWKLALSDKVDDLYCAPGNGGTALIAQNLDMPFSTEAECDQLAGWAFNNQIDLVVVGPEVPLQHGIVDTLVAFGVKVAGPTRAAARLEWSKAWARDFMSKYDIPSPGYEVVKGLDAIRAKLASPDTRYPLVIKADGLAAGKGADVVTGVEQALDSVDRMCSIGALPVEPRDATVVIEEFLEGVEVSAIAVTDGTNVSMLPPACDHKRLLDGNQGPLTGGMGAYSPTQYVTPELWTQIEQDVLLRAVQGMQAEGTPYRGFLYAGLMLTADGPKVLEFNCRLGDPEAQVLLPRLKTPLEDICLAAATGDLSQAGPIQWSDNAAVGVVLASSGYPTSQVAAQKVGGLSDLDEGVLVFHAATTLHGASAINPLQPAPAKPTMFRSLFGRGQRSAADALNIDDLSPDITARGGRLLTVVALGSTLQAARDRVYSNIPKIKIDGVQYRRDIAAREIDV